jgi:benzoyl-CoA reductase/2-hydroxyglutaryl-CoA dehydratase subunit BcrC/BadD/HgdB
VHYVEEQLRELVVFLEDTYTIRYDEEKLRQILQRENESHQLYEKYLTCIGTKSMPSTLTLQMFTLFASHLSIGSEESLHFYRLLLSDVERAPVYTGKKILWVHVLPFYDESLKKILNYSSQFQIQAIEMNSDSNAPMDVSHPLTSVARKLVANVYNKGYEEKAALCGRLARQTQADGVIHFAHWGCKQTSGGVQILKKKLQEDHLPVLLLDGDAVDRRNEGKGQMKTRIEAFCELLCEGERR